MGKPPHKGVFCVVDPKGQDAVSFVFAHGANVLHCNTHATPFYSIGSPKPTKDRKPRRLHMPHHFIADRLCELDRHRIANHLRKRLP